MKDQRYASAGGRLMTEDEYFGRGYDAQGRKRKPYNAIKEGEAQGRRAMPPTLTGEPLRSAEASRDRKFEHPGALESMIPVWGSGKEALPYWEDENYAAAALQAALAASDLVLAKAIVSGLAKGGMKVGGSQAWRSRPWEEPGMRKWLGERGFLKPQQHGHHWAIPQGGWGKHVPDWFKNHPWNIKGMPDAVTHRRIHGRAMVDGEWLPQFNRIERSWYGTPDWFKAANVSAPGHAGNAAGRAVYDDDQN